MGRPSQSLVDRSDSTTRDDGQVDRAVLDSAASRLLRGRGINENGVIASSRRIIAFAVEVDVDRRPRDSTFARRSSIDDD